MTLNSVVGLKKGEKHEKGYVAAGPYFTVSAIKTGIVEQDSEKLSKNIEFPILRQNLKDQLNAVMMKNAATVLKDNPFAALAAGFGAKMVDVMVDSFVTPSGLAALMEGKKSLKNWNSPDIVQQKCWWRIEVAQSLPCDKIQNMKHFPHGKDRSQYTMPLRQR